MSYAERIEAAQGDPITLGILATRVFADDTVVPAEKRKLFARVRAGVGALGEAEFTERLHPRDRKGRFRRKVGAVARGTGNLAVKALQATYPGLPEERGVRTEGIPMEARLPTAEEEEFRGPLGYCFQNAAAAADSLDGYEYVEGYGTLPDAEFEGEPLPKDQQNVPIHHGWLLAPDGKAVDITWPRGVRADYVGVVVSKAERRRIDRTYTFARPAAYLGSIFGRKYGQDPYQHTVPGEWKPTLQEDAAFERLHPRDEHGRFAENPIASLLGRLTAAVKSNQPLWEGIQVGPSPEQIAQVLRDGKAMEPRKPNALEEQYRGPMGWCYENAQKALDELDDGYEYVEGFATPEGMTGDFKGVPIHHGWLQAPDGKAVDVTWPPEHGLEYFGVVIPKGEGELRDLQEETTPEGENPATWGEPLLDAKYGGREFHDKRYGEGRKGMAAIVRALEDKAKLEAKEAKRTWLNLE